MAKPTFSFFTGTQNLGETFNYQNEVIVKFWEGSIPLTSSSGKVLLNLTGKTRIILLQGATGGDGWSGATVVAKLNDFISTMETWINDSQQTSRTFTDDLGNSYNVNCFDWTFKRVRGDQRLLWSLVLKQNGI